MELFFLSSKVNFSKNHSNRMNIYLEYVIISDIEKELIKLSLNTRRILAYIFDVFAVSLIAGALARTPLNPNRTEVEKLEEEYRTITEQYQEKFEEEDDEENRNTILFEFENITNEYSYKISQLSTYEQIISFVCIISYFCILAYYLNGQTIGKKLMKIRITSKDGKHVSLVQLVIGTIIAYEIIFKSASLIAVQVCNADIYFDIYHFIYYLTMVFDITLICTALGRQDRRGLHDLIAKTSIAIEDKEQLPEAVVVEKEN